MKKKYVHFVPGNDGDLAVWTANYKDKIAVVGAQLGLSAEEITSQQTTASTVIDTVNAVEVKRNEWSKAIATRKEAKSTELQTLVNKAIALKRHPNYLPSMGNELGIVGTIQSIDPQSLKPVLSAKVYVGKVALSFNLQGMNCISIYSRIKGTLGWQKLGNDKASPFEDTRPLATANQPEIREYMARYFDGRDDVGQQSDIVSVVFGG